jgi:hypothetical protein
VDTTDCHTCININPKKLQLLFVLTADADITFVFLFHLGRATAQTRWAFDPFHRLNGETFELEGQSNSLISGGIPFAHCGLGCLVGEESAVDVTNCNNFFVTFNFDFCVLVFGAFSA